MKDRKKKAYECFKSGMNCAESVVMAFADDLPVSRDILEGASIAFGGGFARTRSLCGAVAASGIILGFLREKTGDVAAAKTAVYKDAYACAEEFKRRNGTIVCGELLKEVKNLTAGYVPQVRDEEYYKVRPCVKFVLDSVEIIENKLREKGFDI